MSNDSSDILGLGIGLAVFFVVAVIAVAVYVFISYCYKLICEKTGKAPGALIWIPVVRYIPLLQVAKLPEWLVILLLVPFVNLVVFILMWAKVCEARGKSPWLVILWFIPVANLVFIPYLAFSE
jgi:hypothetical protein